MTAPQMPILDRIPSPPSESARYPIRTAILTAPPAEVHWELTPDFPLDQGTEGACVGFGLSAELSATPVVITTGGPFAFDLYARAQTEDKAVGLNFPSGATVLGGLRAAKRLGKISGYRWAQVFEDIRDALVSHGSVVMGTNWREGMDTPTRDGLVRAIGAIRGGHCWALIGYIPNHPVLGEVYEAVNSWGESFGLRGRFYIPAADLRALFEDNGEAAIVFDVDTPPPPPLPPTPTPAGRKWPRLPLWFRRWLASLGIVE